MCGMPNASAFSPSRPCDAPLTASGAQAYSSATLVHPAWRSNLEREESARRHHTHDFEESAQPLIFDGAIPISQRRSATQSAGHKSTKEILPLASYSRTLFYRFSKHAHRPKVPIGQVEIIPTHRKIGHSASINYPSPVSRTPTLLCFQLVHFIFILQFSSCSTCSC
jgi:hypothetical protein